MLHSLVRSSWVHSDLSDTRHAQQEHKCSRNHRPRNRLPSRAIHRSFVRYPRRNNNVLHRQFLSAKLRLRHRYSMHCRTAMQRQKSSELSPVLLVLRVLLFLPIHRTFLAFPTVNVVPNNRPPNTSLPARINGNQQRQDQQQSKAGSLVFHNLVNIDFNRTDLRVTCERAEHARRHPSNPDGRLASAVYESDRRLPD